MGWRRNYSVGELFKANIIIFDEWGDVRFGNSFDPTYQDIIAVAFRVSNKISRIENASNNNRNHYDSIIRLTDDVIQQCAPILMEKYEKARSIKNISGAICLE